MNQTRLEVSLNSDDLNFMLALLSSEEAAVSELESEMALGGCDRKDILTALRGLISDGTIGMMRSIEGSLQDLTLEQALKQSLLWEELIGTKCQLFLTDAGWKRWEGDDWGITEARAQILMNAKPGVE